MRNNLFWIFITIVLLVHTLVNGYIYKRGLQAIPADSLLRMVFSSLFLVFFLSYPLGKILERYYSSFLADVFIRIGSFWFSAMLYFFLFILLFDILRAINHFFPYYPQWIKLNYDTFKSFLLLGTTISVLVIISIGYLIANNPVITQLNLKVNKPAAIKSLKAVLVSDIHLGNLIGRKDAEILTEKINELHPDIILFAGDIVDEDLKPVLKEDAAAPFLNLQSKYGVWAVAGNHEFIGGFEDALSYLQSKNIRFLNDTAVLISNSFWLAGRFDKDMKRFTGHSRKPVEDIVSLCSNDKAIILLDHQPFELNKKAQLGVDIQLSGHTHHGQMFPFNLITKMIFEISRGYRKIDSMHTYVSSGYGTWGPIVRTSAFPEIVLLNIEFKSE